MKDKKKYEKERNKPKTMYGFIYYYIKKTPLPIMATNQLDHLLERKERHESQAQ